MEGIGKLRVIDGEYDRDAPNELGELSKESKQGRVKKVEWKIAIELWGPGFDNCKGDYISCMAEAAVWRNV